MTDVKALFDELTRLMLVALLAVLYGLMVSDVQGLGHVPVLRPLVAVVAVFLLVRAIANAVYAAAYSPQDYPQRIPFVISVLAYVLVIIVNVADMTGFI